LAIVAASNTVTTASGSQSVTFTASGYPNGTVGFAWFVSSNAGSPLSNAYRDFKAFHFEQAIAFKRHLAGQTVQRSGEKLSNATLHATLTQLKGFFFWLVGLAGYGHGDARGQTRLSKGHSGPERHRILRFDTSSALFRVANRLL
jgi:hypothetical protein